MLVMMRYTNRRPLSFFTFLYILVARSIKTGMGSSINAVMLRRVEIHISVTICDIGKGVKVVRHHMHHIYRKAQWTANFMTPTCSAWQD